MRHLGALALVICAGCVHAPEPPRPEVDRRAPDAPAPEIMRCAPPLSPPKLEHAALVASATPEERRGWIEGWMRVGNEAAVTALLRVEPRDVEERWMITAGLAWSGSSRGATRLLAALGDPSPDVRRTAAIGIGLSGELNWARPLSVMAEGQGLSAAAAVEAMGWLRSPWMLPELSFALRSGSAPLREAAAHAICRLGTEGGLILLQTVAPHHLCSAAVSRSPTPDCTLRPAAPGSVWFDTEEALRGVIEPGALSPDPPQWVRVAHALRDGEDAIQRALAMQRLDEAWRLHPVFERGREAAIAARIREGVPSPAEGGIRGDAPAP
jgi:hypothetical protein